MVCDHPCHFLFSVQTLLKRRVKEASLYQMGLFVSSIGLFNFLFFWPIILALHYTNVEVVADVPWTFLWTSSALGVIFNFAINFGIAYTFPLFISLGTILGIPLNAAVDALVRHVDLANWKIAAIDLIVGGFLLILLPVSDSQWIHRTVCRRCGHSRQHRRAAWVPVNMEDEPNEEDSLVSGRSTPDDERQWSNDVDSNT